MAEGLARYFKKDKVMAYSAGTHPKGIDPLAVQVMHEIGIDISKQESKHLQTLQSIKFDYIITLCDSAHQACPMIPGKTIHVGFADPPRLAEHAQSLEEKLVHYRTVRDEIRVFIQGLPENLPILLERKKQ